MVKVRPDRATVRSGAIAGCAMAKCYTCSNESDKSFVVIAAGQTFTFDSFECAIHALAPVCRHCGCRIVGHGVEADNCLFCCANCAAHDQVGTLEDRV